MLCVVFGLSLLDRSNISAAFIAGMNEDLQLTGEQHLILHTYAFSHLTVVVGARYNIALLLFFVTYAMFELPSNLVIRRIGARVWMSFLIIAWGLMVLLMGIVVNWVPLAILRLLLGVFEAGRKSSFDRYDTQLIMYG